MVLESDAVMTLYYYLLVRPECVKVCYDYYVMNIRPSEIEGKYGLRGKVVKGCIARTRVRNSNHVKDIVRELYNILKENPNISELLETFKMVKSYKCPWCDRRYRGKPALAIHITHNHLEHLKSLVMHICEIPTRTG